MNAPKLFVRTLSQALVLGSIASFVATAPARGATIYSNGFETDTAGWDVFGGTNDATRVASGTHGITSAAGSFHAEAAGPNNGQTDDGSAATNWGGYSSNFNGGFTTSLDIYLKYGTSNDTRFDWDSAVSTSGGGFLRDFVFNAGFYNDTDGTGSGNRFVISASNNATRSSAFPKNPGRDPFTIVNEGWYTFEEKFYNNSGNLAADLSIKDAANTVLHTWTLPTTDAIAGVGGNRYGWVVFNEFPFLAIDNASLSYVPEPATIVLGGLGTLAVAAVGLMRRRARNKALAAALCLVVTLSLISASTAGAATITVTPSNMNANGWTFYSTDNVGTLNAGSSTGQMVLGPATPPLGTGSANLMTSPGNGDESEQLRSTSWAGTKLSDLTTLSYSTYATSFNGQQLPFVNLYLDVTGGTTFNDRLWFEPTYSEAGAGNGNASPQPNVAQNTWQSWDMLTGMWYSDSGTPNSVVFPADPNGPGDHAITLSTFLAAYPNARIVNPSPGVGGIRIASGFASPSDNFNTNVDAFAIGTALDGTTTYNFETPEPGTIVLASLGLFGLAGYAVRRRRQKSA